MESKRVVLLYSGGIESTLLLYWYRAQRCDVRALAINYGQSFEREIRAARNFCEDLNVPFEVADVRGAARLLEGLGEAIDTPGEAPKVANRDMLFLSLAIGYASAINAPTVAHGIHCGTEFEQALARCNELSNWHRVGAISPFSRVPREYQLLECVRLRIPLERTWSCFQNRLVHCGTCAGCQKRRAGFEASGALAGAPAGRGFADTTIYATALEGDIL